MHSRARLGAYYTPDDLAARVAALALPAAPGRGAVLDPACGDGALLAAAARRLLALGVPRGRVKLCGVDRDAAALVAARERLRALGVTAHLVHADFLLGDPELPPLAAVVANPPFLSVKRSHLDEADRERLRARYRLARGQFDTCALFLERALAILPPGGRWSFVLPRPVLGNAHLAAARALALQEGGLDFVLAAGAPFGAAVEVVVLAGSCGPAVRIDCGDLPALLAAELRALPGTPLPLGARPDELAFRAGAARAGTPLSALCTIGRGVEAGKRSPGIVPAGAPGSVPVRAGEEVQAFRIAAPRRGMIAAAIPARLRKPDALHRGPKLLVRRVAPRLTAAVDATSVPVLNTLYALHGPRRLLPAIAAALNSAPLRRWFELTFVGGDRIFPYVRAAQLAALPFPHAAEGALADAGRRLARDPGCGIDVDAIVAAALS